MACLGLIAGWNISLLDLVEAKFCNFCTSAIDFGRFNMQLKSNVSFKNS
jgi:hypothetical protein